MKTMRLLISTFTGILVMSFAVNGVASESVQATNASFDLVQYENDVKNIVKAATRLEAICSTEKNQTYCEQADSIMRVLRAYALSNPSGVKSSLDNSEYLKMINETYRGVLQNAFSSSGNKVMEQQSQ